MPKLLVDRRFLITSIGRTATRWLSVQLQVDHEPKVFGTRAVSPTHLWRWLHEGWRPLPGTIFGVVTREAGAQFRSVINRAHGLNPNPKERIAQYFRNAPKYLKILGDLVDNQGAVVMRYEKMTTDRCYLAKIAEHFGCTTVDRFDERVNVYPSVDQLVTKRARELAAQVNEEYERWHSVRGM